MKWTYWISLYLQTHCIARGLRPLTIVAYTATLDSFRSFVRFRLKDCSPCEVTAKDVLDYLEYLRRERNNGASAVNRHATVIKNFYRAIVAMGHMEPRNNPMAHFPKIRAERRKLPNALTTDEVQHLIARPRTDTVLGLRDRAMLVLLYGTGIRASECATLVEKNVDLGEQTIRVTGKGGHERVIPLNDEVVRTLRDYQMVRGTLGAKTFFQSRNGAPLSRGIVYERVRTHARKARLPKRVSPHRLRHTFATHLVKAGVDIITLRDLLGHRQVSSTQIYIHMTADDLRHAAEKHPVSRLINRISDLLPNVKLPMQYPPGQRYA